MEKWIFQTDVYTDGDFSYQGQDIMFIVADSKKEIVEQAISFVGWFRHSIVGKRYVVDKILKDTEFVENDLDDFYNLKNYWEFIGNYGNQFLRFFIYPAINDKGIFRITPQTYEDLGLDT